MRRLSLLCGGFLVLGVASLASAQPSLLGEVLTSNRGNGLPADRAQVVVFYDGAETGAASLGIEFAGDKCGPVWIWIEGLRKFDNVIETREYELKGWRPTGRFEVRNVAPDGVIDGVAFGVFWKDAESRYRLLKSDDDTASSGSRFVLAWPLGMSEATFQARTPQLDVFGRTQATMAIAGAKLLSNGRYQLNGGSTSPGIRLEETAVRPPITKP